MRKTLIILLCVITLLACNNSINNECRKEFKNTLTYLKNYKLDSTTTFSITDLEKKIEFLEIQSGIETEDRGNILGRFKVTNEDFSKWDSWLDEQCKDR